MIYRVDVSERIGSEASALRRELEEAGYDTGAIHERRIFLIDAAAKPSQVHAAAALLADPIAERAEVFDAAPPQGSSSVIEVHLKPGVMDPVAVSTEAALRDLGVDVREVRTGRAFAFGRQLERAQLESIARRYLANSVVETIHFAPHLPGNFSHARVAEFELRHVPIRDLKDADLEKISRDGHLFLNLVEMRAVQAYFRDQKREPTDVELETLAQTWSEHCVHKTLKSAVEVVDETGQVVRRYKNLIKETIFQSTMDLIRQGRLSGPAHRTAVAPFALSVFKDNAGVIVFDDEDAVCFKVETHNRPSAIEPYGGAATGIGGCIRDVLGTGLGARPIANTNVFCVAYPERKLSVESSVLRGKASSPSQLSTLNSQLPPGVIHPKRVLQQVVAGVRDYGNRMGIPTVNGAVHFDENYLGNPLVFAGCVGIIPRWAIEKKVGVGDCIVVMGGRTGRDGIHGATFSSAEVTSTHADEFSHAVQIGNAITQKKMMDVLLAARDRNLYTAVTDCGAGGLSSAIGEMGSEVGAEVDLDKVPLKYAGLRYDEIWISEAQERMVLSVPEKSVETLLKLSADEDVEATVIGTFGTWAQELVLRYNGTEVGRMAMAFMHDGIPMPTRRASIRGTGYQPVFPKKNGLVAHATREMLLHALADPNIASKHWIIHQYDHEVQGGTVIKPLVGPLQIGPSDAAVIRPKATSNKGVVLSCGLARNIDDPYLMALASIDEAIRNAVCVGAKLDTLAILDNFCWPGVHDELSMGTLVRACEACRDGALGYRVPFISGKDSLHNQFVDTASGRTTKIPNTLLISAIGVIADVSACVTSNFKRPGNPIYRVGLKPPAAPTAARANPAGAQGADPLGPIAHRRAVHQFVSDLIASGVVRAAHDASDGGVLVALAEMVIGGGLGAEVHSTSTIDNIGWFSELDAVYLLEIDRSREAELAPLFAQADFACERIGIVDESRSLKVADGFEVTIDALTVAWRGTLDW